MRANGVIDRAVSVIALSVMWILLSALGLIAFGVAPATCAVADVLRARREGRGSHLFSELWSGYRRAFVRANARMLPLMAVQVAAIWSMRTAMASGGMDVLHVAMAGVGVAALAWSTASLAMIVACERIRRQDLAVSYRLALLMPGALPFRAVITLALVAIWALVCATVPVLVIILGAGLALDVTGMMLSRSADELLERLDANAQPEFGLPEETDGHVETAAHEATSVQAARQETGRSA